MTTTAADWQEAMLALLRVAETLAAGAEAAARVAEIGLPPGAPLWWHLGPQGRALRLEAAWSGYVAYHIQVALNVAAGARVVAAASVASGTQLPMAARPSTDPMLLGRRSVPAAAAAQRRQGGPQVAGGAAEGTDSGTDEAGTRAAADRGTYRPQGDAGEPEPERADTEDSTDEAPLVTLVPVRAPRAHASRSRSRSRPAPRAAGSQRRGGL